MIKIVSKATAEEYYYQTFQELENDIRTVVNLTNLLKKQNYSIMEYVLKYWNLYVDGVEFVC